MDPSGEEGDTSVRFLRQDSISLFALAIGFGSLVFLFLNGEGFSAPLAFPVVVAIFLALTGVVGSELASKFARNRVNDVNSRLRRNDFVIISIGVPVALLGFLLSNRFVPIFFQLSVTSIAFKTFYGTFTLSIATATDISAAIFFSVILIPVAEENFFRGFFGNLFLVRADPVIANVAQASVFMLFHIPAYGYNYQTLAVIFADGIVLMAIDEAAQSLSPGIIAHMLNNALAYGAVAGAVVLPGYLAVMGVPFGVLLSLPVSISILAAFDIKCGRLPFSRCIRDFLRIMESSRF